MKARRTTTQLGTIRSTLASVECSASSILAEGHLSLLLWLLQAGENLTTKTNSRPASDKATALALLQLTTTVAGSLQSINVLEGHSVPAMELYVSKLLVASKTTSTLSGAALPRETGLLKAPPTTTRLGTVQSTHA